MNIELRLVICDPHDSAALLLNVGSRLAKLQYRERTKDEVHWTASNTTNPTATYATAWSDWTDVPVVSE